MPETVEESSYTVGAVTSRTCGRRSANELQRARLSRKWKPIDVERAGGPSYKTVQAIENGEAGNIESLDKCARALGFSIVDVLYAVLTSRETPLSPEAAHIVRKFNETTIAGRQALLSVGKRIAACSRPAGRSETGGAAGPRAASIAAWPSGSRRVVLPSNPLEFVHGRSDRGDGMAGPFVEREVGEERLPYRAK